MLEERTLFSLGSSWGSTPALEGLLGSGLSAPVSPTSLGEVQGIQGDQIFVNAVRPRGPDLVEDFRRVGTNYVAQLSFRFSGTPEIKEAGGSGYVSLAGEALWIQPGDPVLPVRSARLLLPPGTEEISVRLVHLDEEIPVQFAYASLATPIAIAVDELPEAPIGLDSVPIDTLATFPSIQYRLDWFRGFPILTLTYFPISWHTPTSRITFFQSVTLEVTVLSGPEHRNSITGEKTDRAGPAGRPSPLPPRILPEDLAALSTLVDNPGLLSTYTCGAISLGNPQLPFLGRVEYVIITSDELVPVFEALARHRQNRGLSATVVSTTYIASNYRGLESGDLADKIRQFLTEAYLHWGTTWVLLGGDAELIPARGVVGRVGSVFERSLATDLYYACLDGPWDGNGNGLWGEAVDGWRGTDIDLLPDIFVGRAPVSSASEAANFINKIIRYESTPHPYRTAALWLGEMLDERTDGGISGEIIRRQTLPPDWAVVERYDRSRMWTTSEVIALLNNSPHLVNHLGHASESYNARLTVAQVLGLSNEAPFLFYSQGCYSGAFDLADLAIGEAHVVAPAAAVATVMNTRYGWYVPGPVPGGNHFYALEFWDALLNERLNRLGAAYVDSILDNLFRVQTTGVYRWIHFGTVLLGDPATVIQLEAFPPESPGPRVTGAIYTDRDGDGKLGPGDVGMESVRVYIDCNANGSLDQGTVSVHSAEGPVTIPDHGTVRTTLTVDAPGLVSGISVWVSLEHQYMHDLELFLISPTGTRIKLLSRPPVGEGSLESVVFSDSASRTIPPSDGRLSGVFRPAEPLHLLEGTAASGIWTLEIVDMVPQDSGQLLGWGLTVTYSEPWTISQADGSFSFGRLPAGSYRVRIDFPAGWQVLSPLGESYDVRPESEEAEKQCVFLLAPVPQWAETLGKVELREITTIAAAGGGKWFSLQPARAGLCTVDVQAPSTFQKGLQVDVYDSAGRRVATRYQSEGNLRVDFLADPTQLYFLRIKGEGQQVELRVVNLLELSAHRIVVYGTAGDDLLAISLGQRATISVAGIEYEIPAEPATAITVLGGLGRDTVDINLGTGFSQVVLRTGLLTVNYDNRSLSVGGVEDVRLATQGTESSARLFGTSGTDRFVWTSSEALFTTPAGTFRLSGFRRVEVWGEGGSDLAKIYDTEGKDRLFVQPAKATLYTLRETVIVNRFAGVYAFSSRGGADAVYFYDSAGADRFTFTPRYAQMAGPGYMAQVEGFRWVQARASNAEDSASIYGSSDNDSLLVTAQYVVLNGGNFSVRAERFSQVFVHGISGSGGLLRIFDSSGDDLFRVGMDYVEMVNSGGRVVVKNFDIVRVYSQAGGFDRAIVHDIAPASQLRLSPGWVHIAREGRDLQLSGLPWVHIRADRSRGITASVYDSSAGDVLTAFAGALSLGNDRASLTVEGLSQVRAVGRYGARLQLSQPALDYVLETTGIWKTT